MSKKRLLITGGCSFTEETYYHQFGVMAWPRIISDGVDYDLLNVGRGGNSNDAIANQITDAVMENKDRDPLVMVLWTESNRVNYFDYRTAFIKIPEIGGSNIYPRVDTIDYSYYALRKTLRTMWKTKHFVESLGLQYFHSIGLHNVMNVVEIHLNHFKDHTLSKAHRYNQLMERIKQDWYFKELGFPIRLFEIGLIHEQLECGHPNQNGHEQIAEMFLDQYLESTKPKYEFVYV